MKILHLIRVILFFAVIALLSACGGGRTSSTVSGVAATGVPILGTVTLKDSNGLQCGPVATDDDGNFSLDVKGLTPPFLLKAEWTVGLQTQTLFSASVQTGNVHINPLTDLALALATGSDPAAVFGVSGGLPDASRISEATLAAAMRQIRTLLTPLLDEYGITDFDPLHGRYVATPENRLDAMLDVIAVKAENGTVTISNRLTGTAIASGSMASPAGILLDRAKFPNKEVLEDIRAINARVGVLGAAMGLGPALTAAELEGLFVPDPAYGTSNSRTRTQDIASIVAIFGSGGSNADGPLKSLRNVRLVGDLSAKYNGRGVAKAYLLNYDFIFENGRIVRGNNVTFGKEIVGGLWKFIGDPEGETAGSNYGAVLYGNYGNSSTFVNGNFGVIYTEVSPGGIGYPAWSDVGGENTVSGPWQVLKKGSIVEISYRQQEVFVPYAEFNLGTGALRLRYGAVAPWSPSAILRPLFQGESSAYQGLPVTARWRGLVEAGGDWPWMPTDGVVLSFQWDDGSSSGVGVGMIVISPPDGNTLSASVRTIGSRSDPAQTAKFLPLTLVSDPISADAMEGRSVSIGGRMIPVPASGWFIQPPLSDRTLTWNSRPAEAGAATTTLSVSFNKDMMISGQIVVSADPLKAMIRLYVESDQYYRDQGMWEGGYTLTVRP
jgi:hypothetical protein